MSLISSTTLDQVQSLQIKDVISGYMDVELIGEKFLCPFHSEHTPSCRIYSASNVIHCFGCGVHEDVVGVVMYKEKVFFSHPILPLKCRGERHPRMVTLYHHSTKIPLFRETPKI